IDIKKLIAAWADIGKVVELMRAAGWPLNADFLSDIWPTTAVILGRHEEIFLDLQEAANARPKLLGLQGGLERIAVMCDRFDIALQAIERQESSAEKTFRKIAVL